MLAGCPKDSPVESQLKRFKPGDWLHDMDAAVEVIKAEKRGDFGPPSQELETKLGFVKRAFDLALTDAFRCWPRLKDPREDLKASDEHTKKDGTMLPYQITTANTDHACLDALGYKRSQ
jgi:hypothetical protein